MHISGKKLDEVMKGHVTARMHIRGWRAMAAMSKMLQPEGIHYVIIEDCGYMHQSCFMEQVEAALEIIEVPTSAEKNNGEGNRVEESKAPAGA